MSSLNSTTYKNNKKNLVEILFTRFVIVFLVVVGFNNSAVSKEEYYGISCTAFGILKSDIDKVDANDYSSAASFARKQVNYHPSQYPGFLPFYVLASSNNEANNAGISKCTELFGDEFKTYTDSYKWLFFGSVGYGVASLDDLTAKKSYCEFTKGGTWDEQTKTCKEKQKECENGSIYDINLGKCRSDCESNNLTYDDAYSNWGGCVSDKCLAKQYKLPEDYGEKPPLDSAYAGYLDKDNCFAECVPDVNICPSGNCKQTITCSYTGTAGLPTNWSDDDKKKVYVSSVGGNGETTSTGDNQGGNNNPESDKEGADKDKTDGDKPGTSSGADGDKEGGSNTGSTTGSETGSQTGSEGGSQTGTEGGTGSGSGDGDSDGKNDGDGKGDGNGDEVVDGDFDGEFNNLESDELPEASWNVFDLFEKYRTEYFKFSRSCPSSVEINIFGQMKTINMDILCRFGDFLRLILHISAYLLLLKILLRANSR